LSHVVFSSVFLLLYYGLNRPELILVSGVGFTAWYPAAGLVMAVLLAVSPWYAILAAFGGASMAIIVYHQPLMSNTVLVAPVLVRAFYAFAAYVLRGPLRIDLRLRHRRDVKRYLLVTLIAAAGSTAVGVLCLVADHEITENQFWSAAIGWFAGDGIGLLGFAPFLLIHVMPWVRNRVLEAPSDVAPRASRIQRKSAAELFVLIEVIGQALSIAAVLWVMFGETLGYLQLYYLAFVPIIWIAMRHGIRGVATGLVLMNFGIVFALDVFLPTQPGVLGIGLVMLAVSATGLVLGSAVTERRRLVREMREQTVFMNSLIENSPLGIAVLDSEHSVRFCNDALTRLFELGRDEIVGKNLDRLILLPDSSSNEAVEIAELMAAGKCAQKHVRRLRKDGSLIDMELSAVSLIIDGRVLEIYGMYQDISHRVRASQAALEHTEAQARMVIELQLRASQLTLLYGTTELLQSCATSREAYDVVGSSCKKLFPEALAGVFYVFKSSRSALDSVATWGHLSSSEPTFRPEACWALRRGRPYWSEVTDGTVVCLHLKEPKSASYLCVPMLAQGDVIGMLHLQFDASRNGIGGASFEKLRQSQQLLASTVAGQIALSLASLRLRESLRDQSLRDPLTGLFNRRFMQESLDSELHRARRTNRSVAVMFMDVDHFKRFNDTYGHEAGDFVLRSLADVFRHQFRKDDIICRYGGEEFAAILPESSSADAAVRAAELRKVIRKMTLRYSGQPVDQVTFSIGIAAFPENGQSGEELLRAADECLYQSKAEGRDRVTVAVV
jgi:diguanylate cyclase (GGDEF)-like protein/PAS domain S-box-containing protein